MKRFVLLAAVALGLPALAHGQSSPAGQAAQPGDPADPAMQPRAQQAVPSDEPPTPPPASDPSRAAAMSSDSDPVAAAEARAGSSGTRLAAALPAGMSATEACMSFKSQLQCATTLYAAQNLNLSFADLKSRVTEGEQLGAAIHELKPDADARSEVRRAQDQARSDLAGHASSG